MSVAKEIGENVGNFLQNPMRDALGLIDDDTYFELLEFHHQRIADVAEYLTSTRDWDLLMTETHASDYTSHFFLSRADRHSGGAPSVQKRCGEGVARTYVSIDRMIGRIRRIADKDTAIFMVSDHRGTSQQFQVVDIAKVLEETRFLQYSGRGKSRRIDWSRTKAANVGVVHIFMNLEGRQPGGIVNKRDYEAVRRDLIATFYDYTDEQTGRRPFALPLTRENAEMVNLWSDLVGDVVYSLRSEFDGAHGKQMPSVSFGSAGQHSTFIASGAGIRRTGALQGQVRVVDVAPTVCYLTGTPMPRNVEGRVVYEALINPDWHLR